MELVDTLKRKALNGGEITRDEAIALSSAPLGKLAAAADEIERKCAATVSTYAQ